MNYARNAGTLVIAVLVAVALAAAQAGQAQGPEIDQAWVGGTLYDFLVTGPVQSAPPGSAAPLYVIAPVDAAQPLHPEADAETHGFGAHDHVLQVPAGSAFRGVCDLTLVVPGANGKPGVNVASRMTLTPAGPRPLVYAANLGQGMQALTSADAIQTAVSLGLVAVVDTKTMLGCLAGPAEPAGCVPDPARNPYTWPGAAALAITIAPCGSGWVRSTPYLIDCPLQCLAPLAAGSTLTISATPSTGYRFAGWDGSACLGQGNPCTLTVPAAAGAINVTADFAPIASR